LPPGRPIPTAKSRAVQLGTYLAGDIVGVDYGPGVDAKCNQFLEHPAIAIVVGRRGASHLLIAAPKDGDPVAGHSDATLAPSVGVEEIRAATGQSASVRRPGLVPRSFGFAVS
jgi:hypothetical protein